MMGESLEVRAEKEARMAARDARKEAVRLTVVQDVAAAENIRLAAELAEMRRLYADMTLERGRLRGALEEARERERAVRDEATGYLVEVAGTLADMHDGEECRFEGGDGCLACYAQGRIGEMQDALAARTTGEERER